MVSGTPSLSYITDVDWCSVFLHPLTHRKNLIFMDHQKRELPYSMAPKVMEIEVSRLRSCTLCVQGPAQKQDVAEPPCQPPKPHP